MGSVIRMFRDSLTNLIIRMGTDRDKAAHTFYGTPLLLYQEIVGRLSRCLAAPEDPRHRSRP